MLTYLLGFLTSDVHVLFRGNEDLSPAWLCSQVTYWRACKETKETQIRADMKSALPDRKQLSHRGCPANQEKKTLKKCQTKDEIITRPCCAEAGHSCLTHAWHLRPCLVNLIIFLHKWLPENGSLNLRLSGETQSSCLFPGSDQNSGFLGKTIKKCLPVYEYWTTKTSVI